MIFPTCKDEIKIFTRGQNPQAIQLSQYFQIIGVRTQMQSIYIIKELVPGGDFLSFLRKKDELTKQLVKFSLDAASGW